MKLEADRVWDSGGVQTPSTNHGNKAIIAIFEQDKTKINLKC